MGNQKIQTKWSKDTKGVIRKNKEVIRRHQRGDQRVQKEKLTNIEGVIRINQKEAKAVNRRTDNAMSKSLEMSKGKSIMVKQIEYIHNSMAYRKETNNDPQSTTQKATLRTTDKPGINSTKPMTYVKL